MSQLVTINNIQISELFYKDQPVVTFEMIAQIHNITVENIRSSFLRHREYFIEDKHYYRLSYNEASSLVLSAPANSVRA